MLGSLHLPSTYILQHAPWSLINLQKFQKSGPILGILAYFIRTGYSYFLFFTFLGIIVYGYIDSIQNQSNNFFYSILLISNQQNQTMGHTASCSTSDQIVKNYSIHDTINGDTRKKINPLKYIQPIRFQTEDQPIASLSFDVQLSRHAIPEQKQNQNRMGAHMVKGQLSEIAQRRSLEGGSSSFIDNVEVKWHQFIKMKKRNFQEDYRIVNQIGRGGFGCVYKVVMRNGLIQRAAKKINKDKLRQDEHQNLLAQMAIMMSLDHPNITKLYEVYDQKTHYIMVLELCEGGELFQKIINRNIREVQARIIIDQLLNALNYIHQKGIVHRDIKPENVLFQKKTKLVKIIDFGISKKITPGQYLTSRVGTPYYIAPEILYRRYDEKCDIWSLGVVLYMIIFNYPPFKGRDAVNVMQNILKDQISYKNNQKSKFSQDAIDFLKFLLNKDPKKRPSAKQALQHKWLKDKKKYSTKGIKADRQEVLDRIAKFHFKDKLQAVVHTFIVSQLLSSEQRIQLLDVFRELDSNKNGIIDSEQIKQALLKKNFQLIDQKKVKRIFEYIDTNCSGHIDYTQFLVAAIDFDKKVSQKHFEQAFTYFDIDQSGEITFEEVVKFLGDEVQSRQQIKSIFMSVDQNGDGVISKSQFVQLLINHRQNGIL